MCVVQDGQWPVAILDTDYIVWYGMVWYDAVCYGTVCTDYKAFTAPNLTYSQHQNKLEVHRCW